MINDPVLKKIGAAHGCTGAQVALAWNLARNITVIVKAENVIHQVENYEARSKCKLTAQDMAAIRELDENGKGGRRFWDMCCAMNLPCYYGLQDGPTANSPVPADYCEDKWHPTPYNKARTDLWSTPKEVCQRPTPA
jgi:Aldo/keto reductase family